MPDERTGERVALAVGADGELVLDVPAVLAAMELAGLARWKLPESVVRIDGPLPTTASGKVQRRHLEGRGHVLWQAGRLG